MGPPAAIAAKEATATVPVVFALAGNPIRTGLVESLSRPGGNRTGLAWEPTPEIAGKAVQVLKGLSPSLARLGLLWHSENPDAEPFLAEARRAAKAFALAVVHAPVRNNRDLDGAFASLKRERAEALFVLASAFTVVHQRRLAELAAQQSTRFELSINVKAAKELDLVIPRGLLLRADHVVQ